jgi:hypothetical protein
MIINELLRGGGAWESVAPTALSRRKLQVLQ